MVSWEVNALMLCENGALIIRHVRASVLITSYNHRLRPYFKRFLIDNLPYSTEDKIQYLVEVLTIIIGQLFKGILESKGL